MSSVHQTLRWDPSLTLPAHGGFIPTCSSGSQNTTSLSAVAHILYLGFHSTTLALPLHGNPHMGLISFVSTSTCPCVSHTIASRSPPLPPIRYLPSALKHTSPWPSAPGAPGAARIFVGGVGALAVGAQGAVEGVEEEVALGMIRRQQEGFAIVWELETGPVRFRDLHLRRGEVGAHVEGCEGGFVVVAEVVEEERSAWRRRLWLWRWRRGRRRLGRGVERFSRAWGEGEERDQSRTVLSSDVDRKVSAAGHRQSDVTGWVCPRK